MGGALFVQRTGGGPPNPTQPNPTLSPFFQLSALQLVASPGMHGGPVPTPNTVKTANQPTTTAPGVPTNGPPPARPRRPLPLLMLLSLSPGSAEASGASPAYQYDHHCASWCLPSNTNPLLHFFPLPNIINKPLPFSCYYLETGRWTVSSVSGSKSAVRAPDDTDLKQWQGKGWYCIASVAKPGVAGR